MKKREKEDGSSKVECISMFKDEWLRFELRAKKKGWWGLERDAAGPVPPFSGFDVLICIIRSFGIVVSRSDYAADARRPEVSLWPIVRSSFRSSWKILRRIPSDSRSRSGQARSAFEALEFCKGQREIEYKKKEE